MKLFISSLILMLSLSGMAQSSEWVEIPVNTTKQLNTISFGSAAVGYIGGNDSLLLKTTDGGQTWFELDYSGVSILPGGEDIVNLKFVNENTGFMVIGSYSGVYQTTDGGSTWTFLEFPGNMCYNHGLFFRDENNGYIGGAGCFQGEQIAIYTDGNFIPATVNTPTFDAADIVIDIDFLNADFGLAVSPGRFLRTTDGGQNWDTIPNVSNYPLTSVEIVNDTLAYAGYIDEQSSGYGLLTSHDSGISWTMETDMANFAYPDYNDVHATANGYIFTVGRASFDDSGILFENKGNGWWYQSAAQKLNSLDSYGDSTVFAIGDSGLVITNSIAILGVDHKYPDENTLIIYPNPSSDFLYFTVNDEHISALSKITIWNLQGQRVYVSNQTQSGIDLTSLSSGSYILEVQSGLRILRRHFVKQ